MRVLFICTGNICRSPMGELLFRTYTQGTSLEVGSAGTHSLAGHSIDPSSKALMDAVGIDSSQFRSTQLTQDIADNSDLILCFEPEQRHNIVVIAPTALPYTFTLTDFSNMCAYCAQHNMITGVTIQERLQSVIDQSMQIRPMLPPSATIPDPYRKNFEAFRSAARATNDAIRNILRSISYNTTPAVQSVKETVQLGNPPHFHGDVVHGDWPLPDLSFDNAVAPADIVVKDNTEVETANTKLIAPDDLPDDVQSDESSDQDEMPVVVEDTSIRDKAAAAEKKSKKRKIIIIASAATVAALLAVGGTVAWHVTSVNAQRDAFSSCKQSATRYAKVKKRYDAAIQNANLLVSVPSDQLADSKTASTLKDALSNAYDFIPTTQCVASLSTENLTRAAKQNNKNAKAMEQSLTTLAKASDALSKSRNAKADSSVEAAKQSLKTTLEQAKSLMDSSKDNVSDEKTRTALQQAIDAANQVLNGKSPSINALSKARESVENAMKTVTDSVAKHNADSKAYEIPKDNSNSNSNNQTYYNPSIYAPAPKQNAINNSNTGSSAGPAGTGTGGNNSGGNSGSNNNSSSNGSGNNSGGNGETKPTPTPTPTPGPTPTPTPTPDPDPTPTPDPDPTPTPDPDPTPTPDPDPTPTPDPGNGGESTQTAE
ncbi:low molecular weight phosphatase family protein [Bifidobacterium catenulatum]|uniref:low molecular weight phosphatase family protein n=3 Tax=Bifidobacterium catenulatum TaxID=1686 RepID=UPI0034A1696B